jgi:hypothetical protein
MMIMIIMMVVVGEEALVGQEGSERDHLHHRLPLALAEQHRLVVAQGNSPDGLAWLREFANEGAGLAEGQRSDERGASVQIKTGRGRKREGERK